MRAMPTPSADLDLVLWGATGFTGRLVARALAHGDHGARWALAGRDRAKLEALRAELGPAHAALPLVLADAGDPASLEALASRARVVCSTVGPYARHGSALVAACARAGTDYCDLTGEVQWMRRMIDAHHAEAERTGARIVHACGFDSVPSVLGTLVLQEHMRREHGSHLRAVRFYLARMRGGVSGGTVGSMLQALDEAAADPAVRRILGNPYALDPDPARRGPDRGDQVTVRYSEELQSWTGPFVMASVNTRVVRRTHALLGRPWGEDFRYSEVQAFGPGPRGLARATAMTAGLGAFVGAVSVRPLRKLVERRLPAPGEGPSERARERGFFEVELRGEGTSARTGREVRLAGSVKGQGDPGYAATAVMLSQSALCLAQDALPARGGVHTVGSALGLALVERLRRAGMTLEARTLG